MSVINVGKSEAGAVRLDGVSLVDSRCLIQANSGGGKSHLLRLIAERLGGRLQTIIIDPEGEFATLREKLDLLIVGAEGEIKPTVRAAPLLARRLAELNVSAVIDLYGVPLEDRRAFVKGFCESLIDLPKSIYHPMLVAIDECHRFAPEKSEGDSVATSAVIGLADSGRKRGIGLVALTQRLSKLHKDVAAELNNVFVGRTWLPNDQERCGKILGMSTADRVELRNLAPGEFYAFGPAIVGANGVIRFRSDAVATTHPKAGERHKIRPPAASEVIVGVAAELADLPQQAEEQIKDLAAAKAKIAALEREARSAARVTPGDAPAARELRDRQRKDAAMIAALRKGLADAMKVIAEINSKGFEAAGIDPKQIKQAVEAATGQIVKLVQQNMSRRNAEFDKLKGEANRLLARLQKLLSDENVAVSVNVHHNEPFTVEPDAPRRPVRAKRSSVGEGSDASLAKAELAVLVAVAQIHPGPCSRSRASALSGYSLSSSSFGNALSALRSRGLIQGAGDDNRVTDAGLAAAGSFDSPPTGAELVDWWKDKVGKAERSLLAGIADAGDDGVSKEDLSKTSGYSITSSSFGNALSTLRRLGLIIGSNPLKLNADAFG